MIVSHRHRFIFLKTTKTAGSALELALAAHCGPDDILAPLGREEEAFVAEGRLPIPQNDVLPRARWTARDWLRLPFRGPPDLLDTHASAAEVRAVVGEQVWREYFKFAVARNPWDRFLSQYHWHYRRPSRRLFGRLTPSEFIGHRRTRRLNDLGWGVYTIDGAVAVDHLCRYENLGDELATLARRIGLAGPLVMPRSKHTTRSDRRHYREVLSAEDGRRIGEVFAAEIALLGYAF